MPEIVGIAAVARNGVIGAGKDIPWRIPEDWRRFKAVTLGNVLIMGRRTYDSIGRPLAGRTTIVISRDREWCAEGVQVAGTVQEAFAQAYELHPQRIFVAGGGEVFRLAWDRLDRLEITEVELEPQGDVTFPMIAPEEWYETGRDEHAGFSFVSYRRCPTQP